jgi:predicted dehydrogenase
MGQAAHLANYAVLQECEVVAVSDLRYGLAQKVAKHYGVAHAYPDFKPMYAGEQLDGVVAAQQFETHGQLIPELLALGVPVITEKPIGRSVEAGRKVADAAKSTKTPLYVGYHKRSDPATVYAKKTVEDLSKSGELGKLKYVRVTMPPGDWVANGFAALVDTDEPYPQLERDPAPAGMDAKTADRYNAFVNYYIHQVNLLRHLLGEDYKVTYADPREVVLGAVSASGVSATIEMAPYETTIDWHEQALICFEKGYVKVELPAPLASNRPGRVTVFRDLGQGDAGFSSPSLPLIHAMRQQARHFVQALAGEPTPLCGPEDAVKDLETAREYLELLIKTQG